jgi:hypothetical protein
MLFTLYYLLTIPSGIVCFTESIHPVPAIPTTKATPVMPITFKAMILVQLFKQDTLSLPMTLEKTHAVWSRNQH